MTPTRVLLCRVPPLPVAGADTSAARGAQASAKLDTDLLRSLLLLLHGSPEPQQIGLELWRTTTSLVRWMVTLDRPDLSEAQVQQMWAGMVPGGDLLPLDDPLVGIAPGMSLAWADCGLALDAAYPLLQVSDTEGDPMAPIVGGMTPLAGVDRLGIQVLLTRPPHSWQRRVKRHVDLWHDRATGADASPTLREIPRLMQAKVGQPGAMVVLRVIAVADDPAMAIKQRDTMLAVLDSYRRSYHDRDQTWQVWRQGDGRAAAPRLRPILRREVPMRQRRIPVPPPWAARPPAVLVPTELAAVWHLPTSRYRALADTRPNTYLPPDARLLGWRTDDPVPIDAETVPLDERRIRLGIGRGPDGTERFLCVPFGSFRMHTQVPAATGTGKSHDAKNVVGEMLRIGAGFVLTDFKGDMVTDVIKMIPPEREGMVAVFDPTDLEYPVGLNLLDPTLLQSGTHLDFLVSQLEDTIASMDEGWDKAVGMQQFVRWGGKAMMEGERTPTFAHLWTFFANATYRGQVVAQVRDLQTKLWWDRTFPALNEQQKGSLQALQRRLDPFLTNSIVRRICNQPTTTIPFRTMLDQRGIILAKLPVELIGPREGSTLAVLLINLILAAAFSRQQLPEAERELCVLMVDEFQEAVGRGDPQAFRTVLERMRSFGLGGMFMHQFNAQLPAPVLEAVLSNVQNRRILSARGADAGIWAKQYPDSGLTSSDWAAIPRREEGYLSASVHGAETNLCTFKPTTLWSYQPATVLPIDADWQTLLAPAANAADQAMDERIALVRRMDRADALQLLMQGPDDQWAAFKARLEAHRSYQRAEILRRPGLIPNQADRIKWLSRLRFARPDWVVQVDLERLMVAFPRDEDAPAPKRGGGGRPARQEGPPAAVSVHHAGRSVLARSIPAHTDDAATVTTRYVEHILDTFVPRSTNDD